MVRAVRVRHDPGCPYRFPSPPRKGPSFSSRKSLVLWVLHRPGRRPQNPGSPQGPGRCGRRISFPRDAPHTRPWLPVSGGLKFGRVGDPVGECSRSKSGPPSGCVIKAICRWCIETIPRKPGAAMDLPASQFFTIPISNSRHGNRLPSHSTRVSCRCDVCSCLLGRKGSRHLN